MFFYPRDCLDHIYRHVPLGRPVERAPPGAMLPPMNGRKWRGHGIVWWIVITVVVLWLVLGVVACVGAMAAYG